MTTKYLIMSVKNKENKVVDIFTSEETARQSLCKYKEKGVNSLYIKQVSTY